MSDASSTDSSESRLDVSERPLPTIQSTLDTSPTASASSSIAACGVLPLYTHLCSFPCPVVVFQQRVFAPSLTLETSQNEITNTQDAQLRKAHTDVETSVLLRPYPGLVCVCLRNHDAEILSVRRMVQDPAVALVVKAWVHFNGVTDPITFRYVRFLQRTFTSFDLVYEMDGEFKYLGWHDGEVVHVKSDGTGSRRLGRGQTVVYIAAVERETASSSLWTPHAARTVRRLVEIGRGITSDGVPRLPFAKDYAQFVYPLASKYALLVNVWTLFVIAENALDKNEFEIFYNDYCRFTQSREFEILTVQLDAYEVYLYAKAQLRSLRARIREDKFARIETIESDIWRKRNTEVKDFKTHCDDDDREAREEQGQESRHV